MRKGPLGPPSPLPLESGQRETPVAQGRKVDACTALRERTCMRLTLVRLSPDPHLLR